MEKTLYEQCGGTYTTQGDYLLPNLKLPPEEERPVSQTHLDVYKRQPGYLADAGFYRRDCLPRGYIHNLETTSLKLSLIHILLNPETLKNIFQLPDELIYKANVAVGWLSPLNHAAYHMHNFGYDLLPRLWQSYLIFGMLIALCFFLTLRAVRKYTFHFTGTEG